MSPVPDTGASALSGSELSHSSLSQVSGADFAKANQFFQPADGGVASQALTGLDIQGISAPAPMAGSEALAMMPPAGGSEAGVLAGLAGANEPISPLIQLIMKLPGAMGIVNSFFEFLANFFLNPVSFFDILNPTMWAHHAAVAFSSTASHMPTISMSILPSNAPILSSMSGFGQPMFSSDLLSSKLNLSLGNSSYSSLAKSGVDAMQTNSFNVGGELTPQTAVYEGAPGAVAGQVPTGHLSGPSLTDVGSANHVATNTRLFSDRLGGGSSFNSMNLAAKTPAPLGSGAGNVGQSVAGNSISSGLNPMSHAGSFHQPAGSFLNNVRFEGAPQMAQLKSNFMPNAGHEVGYSMNPGVGQDVGFNGINASPNTDASGITYGPSGSVGNDLGAGAAGANTNNMIAMDQPVQSFKPTLSGAESQQFRSAFPSGNQSPMAQSGQGAPVSGLKAKQLSLDSIDSTPKSVPGTSHGAPSGKLASAPSHKVADAAAPKSTAQGADAVKAHKAPAADAPKHVSHEAPKHVAHEAPKHAAAPKHIEAKSVSHKAEHIAAKPKAETVSNQSADQQQQLDSQGNAVDQNGNVNEGVAQDGTVADGTEIASADTSNAATQYTVQKGDSLWNIAKDHLGGGAKWQEIYQLNQNLIGQNPDLIYPGTTLQLPGGAPEIASGGTTTMTNYIVKPGDNLWDISHDMLGKGSSWGDIYQANKDIIGADPGLIHPGQQLQVPTTDPSGGGTVASSAVDPSAVDPGAMGAPSAQPVSAEMTGAGAPDLRSGVDSVKSMQGAGTEYGAAAPEQYSMPQTQAAPQQVSSYPESADYMSMNSTPQNGFQPTVAHSKGLPVIPANSTPIEAGPGSAWAATPKPAIDTAAASMNSVTAPNAAHSAATTTTNAAAATHSLATKSPVVAGSVFSNLKTLFGKTAK
jgi:nucleoid-associated protein YgaU